jgi:hypothetical protein
MERHLSTGVATIVALMSAHRACGDREPAELCQEKSSGLRSCGRKLSLRCISTFAIRSNLRIPGEPYLPIRHGTWLGRLNEQLSGPIGHPNTMIAQIVQAKDQFACRRLEVRHPNQGISDLLLADG